MVTWRTTVVTIETYIFPRQLINTFCDSLWESKSFPTWNLFQLPWDWVFLGKHSSVSFLKVGGRVAMETSMCVVSHSFPGNVAFLWYCLGVDWLWEIHFIIYYKHLFQEQQVKHLMLWLGCGNLWEFSHTCMATVLATASLREFTFTHNLRTSHTHVGSLLGRGQQEGVEYGRFLGGNSRN